MSRRNPQRIHEAKLAGFHNRILSEWRQSEERADELLREWETEAATRGLERTDPAYWDGAANWIEEQLRTR